MPAFSATNFQATYVNLAHRSDRRAHMRDELARAGLRAERLSGFNTGRPNDDWWTREPKFKAMRDRTPGAIGCYLTQCEVIEVAEHTGVNAMVLEDDVCFCDDMHRRMEYIENRLPLVADDWDIFWLGATFHCNPAVWHKGTLGRDAERTIDPRIMRTFGIWSTYAYVVNATNARRVLDLFDANVHKAQGIDHLAILLGSALRAYCFVPGCCWQYDNKSDIGVGGDGITRFSGFKKLGPYAWQSRMEDFDPTTYNWAECSPGSGARDPYENHPGHRPMPHPGAPQ